MFAFSSKLLFLKNRILTMTSNLMNRRQFLKTSTLAGGMLLSINLPLIKTALAKQKPISDWCIYVEIKPDNSIVMASPVMDMGQHMKTTGPMILADELDLDWQRVTFAEDCPAYLNKNEKGDIGYQFSDMGTGGSHAVQRNWDYLRTAGATARRMIVEQAAAIWRVSPDSLTTRASYVINPLTQQKLSYGYLAEGAANRQIDHAKITLKQPDEYRIMGLDAKTVDLHQMVTGKPLFGIDADYPNALQVVIRSVMSAHKALMTISHLECCSESSSWVDCSFGIKLCCQICATN
jgi:isoquinoline 1-oxidoreductase beta subunit